MTMATANTAWGFWGTALRALDGPALVLIGEDQVEAEEAVQILWNDAMTELTDMGISEEKAREYLDSRLGRQVADEWLGTQACVRYNDDVEGSLYELDRITGLPAWAKRDVAKWGRGLYPAYNSHGRRVWVTIPE